MNSLPKLRREPPFLGQLSLVRPQILCENQTSLPDVAAELDAAEAHEEEDVEEALVAKQFALLRLQMLRSAQRTRSHICLTGVGATNASLNAATTRLTNQSIAKKTAFMK